MVDKLININEIINKQDLALILEVNKKAIEIETEVADQNEEIIKLLNHNKMQQDSIEESLDKLVKMSEEMNKDLYRIQVLFATGLLSLIIQVVQIFLHK